MSWSLAGGLGAIVVALFTLGVTVFGSLVRAGHGRDLADRVAKYGPRDGASRAHGDQAAARAGSVALDVTKRLMSPAAERRLSGRLELAGVARTPTEWTLLGGCVGVVICSVVSIVTRDLVIGIAVGALVGWVTIRFPLSFRIRRRRAAFAEQLPDLLQVVASSLQSGFSLPQALDTAVREEAQPAAGEFARALAEARLGGDIENGLETIADRMDSDDLRWTVMAIRIQRGIGGNLAEVLTTIVSTIKERGYLRRQVHALAAEGRLSAYILIALPPVMAAYLFMIDPAYMRPLFTTHVGYLILAGAFVLEVVGSLLIRQIIKLGY